MELRLVHERQTIWPRQLGCASYGHVPKVKPEELRMPGEDPAEGNLKKRLGMRPPKINPARRRVLPASGRATPRRARAPRRRPEPGSRDRGWPPVQRVWR